MILVLIGSEGVGKSTLAAKLAISVRAAGHNVIHIDGSQMRRMTDNEDYTSEGRCLNARNLGFVARVYADNEVNVIISAVFPTYVVRSVFRKACERYVTFVHLTDVPFVTRMHGVTDVEPLRKSEPGIAVKRIGGYATLGVLLTRLLLNGDPSPTNSIMSQDSVVTED